MTPKHRIKRLNHYLANHTLKTQREVAESAGIDPSFLSQLRGGHKKFGEVAARNLEKSLNLTPLYFDLDFDSSIITLKEDTLVELNRFRALKLGESCKLNDDTNATRVIGGWIYTTQRSQIVGDKTVTTESSCFAPFTTQHELDGMIDELIGEL